MNNMYFITKKTTATGKKFSIIEKKMIAILKEQKALAQEIGFDQWRDGYHYAVGGFSSLVFNTPPDAKHWKKVRGNEWMPRLTSKEGKSIQVKLDSATKLSKADLNKCIGFKGHIFQTIGFSADNKKYFGFIVSLNWKLKIPKDCEEVTVTKYTSLFKDNE